MVAKLRTLRKRDVSFVQPRSWVTVSSTRMGNTSREIRSSGHRCPAWFLVKSKRPRPSPGLGINGDPSARRTGMPIAPRVRRPRPLRREEPEYLFFVTTRTLEEVFWLHPRLRSRLAPVNREARRVVDAKPLRSKLERVVASANRRRAEDRVCPPSRRDTASPPTCAKRPSQGGSSPRRARARVSMA